MTRRVVAILGLVGLVGLGSGCGDDGGGTPVADTSAADDAADDTAATEVDAEGTDAIAADTAVAEDTTPATSEIVVMSYNVMCSFCSFEDHQDWVWDWDTRLPWIRDTITRHAPDLIGVQELATIDGSHPDQVEAIGGPDGIYGTVFYRTQPGDVLPYDYPDATIYYRLSRFTLVDEGAFWLSDTPDVAFSHGWNDGPSAPRIVVWAVLHDRVTDRDLTFATTHFDNNAPNQVHSAPLSLAQLGPMAAERPLIFVGDYNSRPTSEAYAILAEGVDAGGFHLDNAYDRTAAAPGPVPADGGRTDWTPDIRIDHIWFSGPDFTVSDWAVDLTPYGDFGQAASDHYAIVSTLVP